jgi:hypothetical protein
MEAITRPFGERCSRYRETGKRSEGAEALAGAFLGVIIPPIRAIPKAIISIPEQIMVLNPLICSLKGGLDWSLTARMKGVHSDRAHSTSERDHPGRP